MMCYYLNVHFQGQRVKVILYKCKATCVKLLAFILVTETNERLKLEM